MILDTPDRKAKPLCNGNGRIARKGQLHDIALPGRQLTGQRVAEPNGSSAGHIGEVEILDRAVGRQGKKSAAIRRFDLGKLLPRRYPEPGLRSE